MDIATVKLVLLEKGLFPVVVVPPTNVSEDTAYMFQGTLEEYCDACEALGVRAVLVEAMDLDAEYYVHEHVQSRSAGGAVLRVDLRKFEKALSEYTQYVGHIGLVRYSAVTTTLRLDSEVEEEWWTRYSDLYANAIDKAEEGTTNAARAREEADAAKRSALIAKLRVLADRQDFRALPTQKAMLAYALEKIEVLDSIDTYSLKTEIQDLVARLHARKRHS